MNNKRLIIFIVLILFFTTSYITGQNQFPTESLCSKSEIVGTWRYDFSSLNENWFHCYSQIVLNEDGTGRITEYDKGKTDKDQNFSYTYNPTTCTLVFQYTLDNKLQKSLNSQETYKLKWITKNGFYFDETDGGQYIRWIRE